MWTIPSAEMKRTKQAKLNDAPHVVPMARQAVQVLAEPGKYRGRAPLRCRLNSWQSCGSGMLLRVGRAGRPSRETSGCRDKRCSSIC